MQPRIVDVVTLITPATLIALLMLTMFFAVRLTRHQQHVRALSCDANFSPL